MGVDPLEPFLEDARFMEHRQKGQPVCVVGVHGYFFADQLQSVLDVPVGLVCAAWSGSKIEPWMDKAALDSFPEIDWSVLDREIKYPAQSPTLLFNAMIHPLKINR